MITAISTPRTITSQTQTITKHTTTEPRTLLSRKINQLREITRATPVAHRKIIMEAQVTPETTRIQRSRETYQATLAVHRKRPMEAQATTETTRITLPPRNQQQLMEQVRSQQQSQLRLMITSFENHK
jgi:hypothetical protein